MKDEMTPVLQTSRDAQSGSSFILHPSSFTSYLTYEATYWFTMCAMTLGFSLRTLGRRNIPLHGPALLIANHQSFVDPVLVGLATRRHLCFLARQTLFRKRAVGWFLRQLGGVPIDHEGVGKDGIKTILGQLRAGRAVVVFPEGTRSRDGKLQPLRPGVQLIIKRTEAPIIPVGIAGAYDAWPRTQLLPTPAPLFLPADRGIAVAVGKRLDAGPLAKLPRERCLTELFAALQSVQQQAERLRRKA
jgi:1-acyl-sn-glycerol-3-phosphate acyltransferase